MAFTRRQFTVRWLLLLMTYVGVLAHYMAGRVDAATACAGIAFWLSPVWLSLQFQRRLPLAIWCAAAHLVSFVLLDEVFFFNLYHTHWGRLDYLICWIDEGFFWMYHAVAEHQQRIPVGDDYLSAALLGTAIFPIVGVAFSYCARSVPASAPSSGAPPAGFRSHEDSAQAEGRVVAAEQRPRPRFSIRLLKALAATLATSAALTSVAIERRAVAERRSEVDALVALGVRFLDRKSQPLWHELLMGDDQLSYGRMVRACGVQNADAVLARLRGMTRLDSLWLISADITDAGLVHLEGLMQLRLLKIRYTQITDAGIVHLQRLTALQELDVSDTRITGAGLTQLAKLTQLRRLVIDQNQAAGPGLRALQNALPNCACAVRPR